MSTCLSTDDLCNEEHFQQEKSKNSLAWEAVVVKDELPLYVYTLDFYSTCMCDFCTYTLLNPSRCMFS